MAVSYVQEMYTDQINIIGSVRRVYFHALYVFDSGLKEWHYFGTKVADKPPTTADATYEHQYIQDPTDWSNVPFATQEFYSLSQKAARIIYNLDGRG